MHRLLASMITILLVSSTSYAEVLVHRLDESTIKLDKDIAFYPKSEVDRPLILPPKMIEIGGKTIFRHLNKKESGLALLAEGRYGVMEDMEATLDIGLAPLSYDDNFQFGGVAAGVEYALLRETEQYPELSAAIKLGFAGSGALSLTSGSTFMALPSINIKKTLKPKLAMDAGLTMAFGNGGNMGLDTMKAAGIYSAYDDLDVITAVSLEGVGLDKKTILSINPSALYHLNDQIDIRGGFRLGIFGAEALGNNIELGLARRF